MNYLTVENLSKSFGDKILFKNITFHINKGQKTALVAQNGTGKTTLLEIIAGKTTADGPQMNCTLRKGIQIGYLEQDNPFDNDLNILEVVLTSGNPIADALNEYDLALISNDSVRLNTAMEKMDHLNAWEFEGEVKKILGKLNLHDTSKKARLLSGGEKKRLALAKILIQNPEFLILDEPTNHLDIDMIEWLEAHLKKADITVLMVTHDRYFLDRVCTQILEIENNQIYKYSGNYSDFIEKKLAREENESVTFDRQKKLLKKELQWIRKQPKARGTKSKARVEKFHAKKEELDSFSVKDKMQIEIKGERLGSKILEAHYLHKGYDNRNLITDFHYKFKKSDKIGIIGKNGCGKSTLIKLLTKEIKPDQGKVVHGSTLKFGHFSQGGLHFDNDKKVIDIVRDIAEYIPLDKGRKLTASQLLERFLFSKPHQQVFVSKLSGGEKRRLYLLTILMTNPNFLILDEPTNDLDIITLNILEEFLISFPGVVLIVSHDRYFMDKIVSHLFAFEPNGKIRDFNGTHTAYREFLKTNKNEKNSKAKPKDLPKQTEKKQGSLNYFEQKELKQIEIDLPMLEKKKEKIMEAFENLNIEADKAQDLSMQLGKINKTMEELEMRWFELEEKKS